MKLSKNLIAIHPRAKSNIFGLSQLKPKVNIVNYITYKMAEQYYDPSQDVSNLEMENQQLRQKNLDLSGAMTSQSFAPEEEQNLIQYQLETDKILERIEHFLRGDTIKFNDKGSYFSDPTKNVLANIKKDLISKIKYYIQEVKESGKGSEVIEKVLVKIENKNGDEISVMEQDSELILGKLKDVKLKDLGYKYVEINDDGKKPFNDYGVAELMRIISMYVTKETFLSYYTEERINEIMGDLGDEFNNFLYCNYEKMGMDTKFKESKYSIIILNILHTIESCYRRALGGAEQHNIRSRSIVTQTEGGRNLGAIGMAQANSKEKWSPVKPRTW